VVRVYENGAFMPRISDYKVNNIYHCTFSEFITITIRKSQFLEDDFSDGRGQGLLPETKHSAILTAMLCFEQYSLSWDSLPETKGSD